MSSDNKDASDIIFFVIFLSLHEIKVFEAKVRFAYYIEYSFVVV